ncbi:hypothetical protein COCC4DRAFT_130149 [Bipolaris maydis ATCC 48331]|uniref:Uncharacterized protein n=2 Tax=Cochliobolus heterostrophus TaxID=5016 RepID=M2UXL6_COCH5|nr:uncharacterized protein COCC4DRAFT_130149 [Bipolaris maydis ATCC 48331]EMD92532.1 hypothetical protein COCHEDRAFT_1100098 [Bipolaris maydis C5]KAH7552955.1 hypothetical protein BM1_07928 [Bipolaris maydis]ENI08227.1 hypothetical protein COCC4DRAFT_130149 [Bipolaris maydis ATCC 48331]KAJ5022352.1 hypothetical protein J3E73DRAFT_18120 [Bipolaris maydis]KAJ5061046.1 hypothetical protein J3E74DRAFT_41974 [Bipolaris maydis]
MPLCTLHLLALHTTPNSVLTFLSTLKATDVSPLVVSRVVRWIILPTKLSTEHLLARNIHWDLLLVLPSTDVLPSNLTNLIEHHWSVTAGVPSRLVNNFASKNTKLLHPDPQTVPMLQQDVNEKTTQSSQSLELSDELNMWIQSFVNSDSKEAKGAVSMFNLLAFNPGMKEEYLKYGSAFARSIGSRHGGDAKIVGNVTHVNGEPINRISAGSNNDWDEIALAHYPSILHFRDMLVSEDYQVVNKRHRVPSLKDTCILMTSEIAVERTLEEGVGKARL